MTFKLNQISTSAEGREIRRAKEVPGDRLTIGRSPASGVHLTDLAVALTHATVQRVTPLRLSVAAEEGLGVELNGRKVTSGFIELAQGGEIRIASHLLRFPPSTADAKEIQVDVERVGESAADEADKVDIRRFSVGAVLPGKRISAYVLMALVLGVFLAWPLYVYNERTPANNAQIVEQQRKQDGSGLIAPQRASFSPDSMWSTGSLSSVHHGLEGQCSSCHVKAFEPVQDKACLDCHQNIQDHGIAGKPRAEKIARFTASKTKPTGFDGFQHDVAERLGHTPGRCVECHTEHEGPQEPQTAETNCSGCHTGLNQRLPRVEIGNASNFGEKGQHPEFRPVVLRWAGEQPQLPRVALDQRPAEDSRLKFPHAVHLNVNDRSMTTAPTQMVRRLASVYGGRQSLTCSDCHTPTPDGARYQPVDMEQDCAACHTLAFDQADGLYRTLRHGSPQQVIADLREFYRGRAPARPQELAPVARRRPGDINQVRTAVQYARARAGAGPAAVQAIQSVFKQGGACYDCHVIEQRGPLDFHVRPVAFPNRYLLHGWFDHKPHAQMNLDGENHGGDQACLTCHGDNPNLPMPTPIRSNQASKLMLPGLESCQRCHVGEDSNKQVAGQRVESGCAMCHDYHMDEGVPAQILRQQVRGNRWRSTTIPVAQTAPTRPMAALSRAR